MLAILTQLFYDGSNFIGFGINMQATTKALWALMLTIMLWASAFVGIRYVMMEFSAGSLAFARYFIASIAMIVPFLLVKNKKLPTLRDFLGFFILGFLGFFVYNLFLNQGEISVSAGIANFIVSQLPVIVALLAIFFFHERLNYFGILGFILSLCGGLVIVLAEKNVVSYQGIILIYIATVSGAIFSCMQKKYLTRYHPIEVISYCIWFGTLALSIYLPKAIHELSTSHFSNLLVIIYMGILPGAVAYGLWCYAFKHIKASAASSFLYIMPVLTLLMAWVLLNEKPDIMAIVGGMVAVAGAIVITRFGVKK